MSVTADDLAALKAAYARGARRARMGDEEIEYVSGDEMRRRIVEIERELGLPPTGGAAAFANPTFNRGI